jgi:cytochrome c oxidase subunit 3
MIWWKDVIKEAKKEGNHQKIVIKGLKIGIILFITSEVMFFLSFFWTYFHEGISPSIEIGQMWPPTHVKRFNPTNVPLLSTLILISSGVSITWSHHSLLKNNKKMALKRLTTTCLLGAYFSFLQAIEYIQAEFNINDSRYGSIFFLATGFHGIHVIIGTTFLMTTLTLMLSNSVSVYHHRSFEIAA